MKLSAGFNRRVNASMAIAALCMGVHGTGIAQSEPADHHDGLAASTVPPHSSSTSMDAASVSHAAMTQGQCQDQTLPCAKAATPAFAPDGSLWLTWSGGGAVMAARSTDLGQSFGPAIEIAKHDAFLDTGPDARPSIVIDKDYRISIAYAFFKDRQWNAQANITTSLDRGNTFTPPHALADDPSSQRFPSLALTPTGKLFAIWIDKRLVAAAKRQGKPAEGGSIAYAWSSDMGQSFEPDHISEPSSCECCRIALGLSKSGLPVVVYRANFDGTTRDHAAQIFSSATQPGRPLPIADDHWVTNSCPHHGPAVAVSTSGILHTAWYTQGSNRSGTFYARSTDAGLHFSTPMQLGDSDKLSGRPYLLTEGKAVWLVWKNFDGRQASVWLQRSVDEGKTWTPPKQIAQATGYTDHPLLISHDQNVYLSWLTAARGYQLQAIEP